MSRAKYNLSNDTDVPSCFPAKECRYAGTHRTACRSADGSLRSSAPAGAFHEPGAIMTGVIGFY